MISIYQLICFLCLSYGNNWYAGLQIATAMMYMHEHSIIFRDLKPQNIGFDVRGDVKIFDFGLARIMPEDGNPYTDTFEMSGAGSPRWAFPWANWLHVKVDFLTSCAVSAVLTLKIHVTWSFEWQTLQLEIRCVHFRHRFVADLVVSNTICVY